jgi:DNA-binding transcriptional LysR family regulator
MNVSDVQTFSRVASSGSFNGAARLLGVTRSAVSKSMGRLEETLGVVLLHRSPRSLSLTDAGQRFLIHALEIDAALEAAVAAVNGSDQEVAGRLSVSISTSLGAAITPALINSFRAAWPRLNLCVQFDERYADLIGSGLDVAIRIAERLDDSTLLSKRLSSTSQVLVASPSYLAKYGTPTHPKELQSHHCLALGSPAQPLTIWRFRHRTEAIEVPIECVLTTNTDLPLIIAACLGDGILYIPKLLVGGELKQGRLVTILADYTDSRQYGVYAVYPHRNPPAKGKAFIEFVTNELPSLESVDRWAPFGQLPPAPLSNAEAA